MCKILVANGADVDAQNAGGNTPLHMVTSYDIDDVKAYLDEQGANGTIKNQEGFQARYGLSGEKDPTSVAFAVETFRSSSDEKSLLNALDTLKKNKRKVTTRAAQPGQRRNRLKNKVRKRKMQNSSRRLRAIRLLVHLLLPLQKKKLILMMIKKKTS